MPRHVKGRVKTRQHAARVMVLVLTAQVAPNRAIGEAHEHAVLGVHPVNNAVPVRETSAEYFFAVQAHPQLRVVVAHRAGLDLERVGPAESVWRKFGTVRTGRRNGRAWVRLQDRRGRHGLQRRHRVCIVGIAVVV